MFATSALKRIACTVLVATATILGTVSHLSAEGSRYFLRLENASSYDIRRVFVSSSDDPDWQPDQLGTSVLHRGETFTITNIAPGEYDVKFVDEDGDSCTVNKVNVFRNTSWKITNAWLLGCEFQ